MSVPGEKEPGVDTIAGSLREVRKSLLIKQESVARRLGVKRTTISAWENGSRQPGETQLHRWAAVLGCRIAVVTALGQRREDFHRLALERFQAGEP